jgi:CubicO group peptidase (beta-lactamase class C family)
VSLAGRVAPGFERVADAFSSLRLGDGGAAACVYVAGECVVDCWAGDAAPGVPWERDTRAAIFSATKALSSATVMLVAERAGVDTNLPLAHYWPPFAAEGKAGVLVRHALAHTSGVLSFPGHADLLTWDGDGWDRYDEIAERLCAAVPAWEPGTRHGYHALTFGWMADQLVRHVDGRTIGRVLADDLAGPIGADVRIGTPPELVDGIAHVDAPPVPTSGPAADAWRAWQDPSTLGGQAFFAGPNGSLMSRAADFARAPQFLAAEVPAGNGTGTARGLAAVCASLAERDPGIWRVEQASGPDAVLGGPTRWALGFELPVAGAARGATTPLATSGDAFGHGGFGGQLALVDPSRQVGMAFIRSHLEVGWPSAARLVAALVDCLPAAP